MTSKRILRIAEMYAQHGKSWLTHRCGQCVHFHPTKRCQLYLYNARRWNPNWQGCGAWREKERP